jgi:hypothetical protein
MLPGFDLVYGEVPLRSGSAALIIAFPVNISRPEGVLQAEPADPDSSAFRMLRK